MNILTHPVHTGYQYDLARTGHEFYSLKIPGTGEVFWDERSRPKPKNFHPLTTLNDAPVNFDLVLVHFDQGYDCLKNVDVPMIYKEHCLRRPFAVPESWQKRIHLYSFASQTAATRWILPPTLSDRKMIIGMGIEPQKPSRTIRSSGILAVGQNIRSRGDEKGYGNLLHLSQKFPITTVGIGSKGILGAVGVAPDYEALLRHYRSHRIFLNPAPTLGLSTLEAMGSGLAVVTFRMINSDIIRDGYNGLVVDSLAGAEKALKLLLRDDSLASKLGKNARLTIKTKFKMHAFVQRWNALFLKALCAKATEVSPKSWQPFDLNLKSKDEQRLAADLMQGKFEYQRVGYDKRTMEFLPNGWIGKGAGGCEMFWDIKTEGNRVYMEISSARTLTCQLKRLPNGYWSGRWIHYEKMPILIRPLKVIPTAAQV